MFKTILLLGLKELKTLKNDKIMLFLLIYSFTFAIFIGAKAATTDLVKAPVAFVDEDKSALSGAIIDAFYKPRFLNMGVIGYDEVDHLLDSGTLTFVVIIPSGFEKGIIKGQTSALQLNIDATRMSQAGVGTGYIGQIVSSTVQRFFNIPGQTALVELVTNFQYNPNLEGIYFGSINEIISNVMMLAILLSAAALIREKEHGTIEHLLVMPVTANEIILSKIWSTALVILIGVSVSLIVVVQLLLDVPVAGSIPLFLFATALVLFATTSMGIFMATISRSMPQLGMLFILIILPLLMLSGGITPFESMPLQLQYVMQMFPTSHFMDASQAILLKGADFAVVWKQFVAIFCIGVVFYLLTLRLFKRSI
jgi:ABC-2 type transport system permease protein